MELKPGTRCECPDTYHVGGNPAWNHPMENCPNDAVRLVTVETQRDPRLSCVHVVPLCAACAEYHERGSK